MRRVRRERWTAAAALAVGSRAGRLLPTYMAYRNLKSVVPLLRPGDLFDRQLADLDRSLFAATIPPRCCTTSSGTGIRRTCSRRLRGVHRLPAAHDRRRAGVLPRPAVRALLHDGAVDQLGAGRRKLLPAAIAGTDLRLAGRVREPARLRGHPAAGDPARPAARLPARPGDRDAAEHRGASPRCTSR